MAGRNGAAHYAKGVNAEAREVVEFLLQCQAAGVCLGLDIASAEGDEAEMCAVSKAPKPEAPKPALPAWFADVYADDDSE